MRSAASRYYALPMSQPQAIYRHQYVSGAVASDIPYPVVPGNIRGGWVYVLNRGATAEAAKVQFWLSLQGSAQLVWESDAVVHPGTMWTASADVVPTGSFSPDMSYYLYWAVIWTSSPDLVPSCAFLYQVFNDEVQAVQTTTIAYFAPGDFAQFAVHSFQPGPPRPPIGPIEP
jgi:hypothetical protein